MSGPVVFHRGDQLIPDYGGKPTPLTWERMSTDRPPFKVFEGDLALCTCANGHTCRISATVHTIATDGTLVPSYVCPVPGCSFHEYVKLEGWDG